jgi:hypothetical protein
MLTLHIDRPRFDANLKAVLADVPGLVPVVKGNGYGLGVERLAGEVVSMGLDTVAVGTFAEACTVLRRHAFDRVLVMTPHLAGESLAALEPALAARVVHTVTTAAAAADLAGRRCVVELQTPLRRHGVTLPELTALMPALGGVQCEGFAVHLPMSRPRGYDPVAELTATVEQLDAQGLPTTYVYVSHLSGKELAALATRFPRTKFRARVGTRLWLGDRAALVAKATVLDVIAVARGDRYGYRQHKALRAAHLVVVSGGTAHGVGLSAPKPVSGVLGRARVVAEGVLAAGNRTLSPFVWGGRRRWFAETPHMQVSLLEIPDGVAPPKIGDELTLTTRMTTTYFDAIVES